MRAKCLLVGILLLGIAVPALAGTGWRSLVFEDFESKIPPALPTGWVTLNPNSDQGAWETWDHGGVEWGRNCARYTGDPANYPDDWIMTPGVALTAGTVCTVKFMTRATWIGNPFTLEVRAGIAQNPGDMTILALSQPILFEAYAADSGSFVVPATGTYYIGFHVTGAPGIRRLYLDDVEVDVPETGLILALGMSKSLEQVPLVYSVGDTIEAVVMLANTGAAPVLVNKRFAVGTYPGEVELDFYVTGPDGLRVPCINMFAKMADLKTSDFTALQPDSLTGKVLDIRGWYGFYTPGAYSIQVHYRNRWRTTGGWMGELVSDPLAITIQ
jgi:hypothetical protein